MPHPQISTRQVTKDKIDVSSAEVMLTEGFDLWNLVYSGCTQELSAWLKGPQQ